MITALTCDPKGIGEKKLAKARAFDIRFRYVEWRAVYEVRERQREVRVLSFGPHDKAYRDAEKRM